MKPNTITGFTSHALLRGTALLSLTVALQAYGCNQSAQQTPFQTVHGMANLATVVPGQKDKNSKNALFFAIAQKGNEGADALREVLDRIAKGKVNLYAQENPKDQPNLLDTVNSAGNPPFCEAVELGNTKAIEALMQTYKLEELYKPNERTGETPLMLAISKGAKLMVLGKEGQKQKLTTVLIETLDPETLQVRDNRHRRTALHVAARCNAQQVFEQLYAKLKHKGKGILFNKARSTGFGGFEYSVFAATFLPKNAIVGRVVGTVFKKKKGSSVGMFKFALDHTEGLEKEDYEKIKQEIDELTFKGVITNERRQILQHFLNEKLGKRTD